MKKSLFFLYLLISLIHAQAQAPAPAVPARKSDVVSFSHWSIGFTIGPAFPVGQFNLRSSAGEKSGFAKTGAAAELSGAYFFNSCFGVALAVARQENPVGNPKDQLNPPTPNYPAYPPAVILHNRSWKISRIQAGSVFNIALAARGLSLQIRALAGILKTAQPGFHYNKQNFMLATSSGETAAISLPWTFSYQSDIGLNWKISHRLAFVAKAGYTGSTAVIRDPPYLVNGFITGGVLPEKREYSLSTVYAQAGVGFSF